MDLMLLDNDVEQESCKAASSITQNKQDATSSTRASSHSLLLRAAFSCGVHPRTRTRPLEQDRSGAPTIRFLYEQFEDFVEKPWLAVVESFALGGGCQLLCIVLFANLFGCRRQRMVCPRSRPTRPAKRQPRAPGNLLPDRTARPRARRGLPAPGPAQALFRH